jgi:hypothetical protein
MTAVATSGFTFVSWWQSYCVRGRAGRPDRPRTQHDSHHDTKVKPEAATAFIELLMMGGTTSETCWAVNKRQDNKVENCCISSVIYLNWKMIDGLKNLKLIVFIPRLLVETINMFCRILKMCFSKSWLGDTGIDSYLQLHVLQMN